ncbi:hypothetical protein Hanom_Chr04g00381211 [Helianthus anomalus]
MEQVTTSVKINKGKGTSEYQTLEMHVASPLSSSSVSNLCFILNPPLHRRPNRHNLLG